MNVKRIVGFFSLLFVVILFFSACEQKNNNQDYSIDLNNSYYIDYSIEEDIVVVKCHYVIINNTLSTKTIQLFGDFQKDHDLGLVSETQLFARKNPVNEDYFFEVMPGKNEWDVFFVGTYGGQNKKSDRLLPETTIIH